MLTLGEENRSTLARIDPLQLGVILRRRTFESPTIWEASESKLRA